MLQKSERFEVARHEEALKREAETSGVGVKERSEVTGLPMGD